MCSTVYRILPISLHRAIDITTYYLGHCSLRVSSIGTSGASQVMSSLMLSLSSKDERPTVSLLTYQHGNYSGNTNVDCHWKVSVPPGTVQGQVASPFPFHFLRQQN